MPSRLRSLNISTPDTHDAHESRQRLSPWMSPTPADSDPESEVSYKGHSPACEKWYLIPVAPKVPVWSTCGAPSHPSEELYKQTPSL